MICPLEERGEGQSCIFIFLHPDFSSHALKLEEGSTT